MDNLYMKIESMIFCLLITAFLYVFRSKSMQHRSGEDKFMYWFMFATMFFSILGDIVLSNTMQIFCFAMLGLCSFGVAYCFYRNALTITGCNATNLVKSFSTVACVIFGFVSFFLVKSGKNSSVFLMVLSIIVLFVWEQHNKIRVDNLTKLYNRYGMEMELKEQLRQYEREHADSFYVIACDLDNFKHINDTWGHSEGDRALVLVAGALSRVGKKYNTDVFRIGGDEFIIITDTSEEGLANDVANEIKSEFDKIEFRDDFDIKISIGIALYDGVTAIDELLNSADKKLYEAKKMNRW